VFEAHYSLKVISLFEANEVLKPGVNKGDYIADREIPGKK